MVKKTWMLKQAWCDLLFLHWTIHPDELRRHIPVPLEMDIYDNKAWVGIVLFKARGTRWRFLPPIPGPANFLEVNVRTYVRHNEKSGVYFFSLDANSRVVVETASFGGFLPYRHAKMSFGKDKDEIEFKSRVGKKGTQQEEISLKYRVSDSPESATNLEKWLTERYCLWTKPGQHLLRLDIEHEPWKLKYVEGDITINTLAPYLGKEFNDEKPLAHYAEMKNVRFFPPIFET